ncbi:hypothetical protein [Paenibacillus physcomitrellae]|nr:hypothetical protein [Paenibacillus physcomitrellae]
MIEINLPEVAVNYIIRYEINKNGSPQPSAALCQGFYAGRSSDMKYDMILRFIAAIAFFTFVPFVQAYPWATAVFAAAGIYCAVTGFSKIIKPGGRE